MMTKQIDKRLTTNISGRKLHRRNGTVLRLNSESPLVSSAGECRVIATISAIISSDPTPQSYLMARVQELESGF